jgi:hypothetical protein
LRRRRPERVRLFLMWASTPNWRRRVLRLLYDRFTIFGQHRGMPDDDTRLALRTAYQARTVAREFQAGASLSVDGLKEQAR